MIWDKHSKFDRRSWINYPRQTQKPSQNRRTDLPRFSAMQKSNPMKKVANGLAGCYAKYKQNFTLFDCSIVAVGENISKLYNPIRSYTESEILSCSNDYFASFLIRECSGPICVTRSVEETTLNRKCRTTLNRALRYLNEHQSKVLDRIDEVILLAKLMKSAEFGLSSVSDLTYFMKEWCGLDTAIQCFEDWSLGCVRAFCERVSEKRIPNSDLNTLIDTIAQTPVGDGVVDAVIGVVRKQKVGIELMIEWMGRCEERSVEKLICLVLESESDWELNGSAVKILSDISNEKASEILRRGMTLSFSNYRTAFSILGNGNDARIANAIMGIVPENASYHAKEIYEMVSLAPVTETTLPIIHSLLELVTPKTALEPELRKFLDDIYGKSEPENLVHYSLQFVKSKYTGHYFDFFIEWLSLRIKAISGHLNPLLIAKDPILTSSSVLKYLYQWLESGNEVCTDAAISLLGSMDYSGIPDYYSVAVLSMVCSNSGSFIEPLEFVEPMYRWIVSNKLSLISPNEYRRILSMSDASAIVQSAKVTCNGRLGSVLMHLSTIDSVKDESKVKSYVEFALGGAEVTWKLISDPYRLFTFNLLSELDLHSIGGAALQCFLTRPERLSVLCDWLSEDDRDSQLSSELIGIVLNIPHIPTQDRDCLLQLCIKSATSINSSLFASEDPINAAGLGRWFLFSVCVLSRPKSIAQDLIKSNIQQKLLKATKGRFPIHTNHLMALYAISTSMTNTRQPPMFNYEKWTDLIAKISEHDGVAKFLKKML